MCAAVCAAASSCRTHSDMKPSSRLGCCAREVRRVAEDACDVGTANVASGGERGDALDVIGLTKGLEVRVRSGEEGTLELLEEVAALRVLREGHDTEHGEHRYAPQEDGQEGLVCAGDAQRANCGEVERGGEPVYTPVAT